MLANFLEREAGQGEFSRITREQTKARLAWLDSLGSGQLSPADLKRQIRRYWSYLFLGG